MVSRVLTYNVNAEMAKKEKYVMAGTDEEVLMGDVLEVEFEKDFFDGKCKVHRTAEYKVTEDSIPYLLDMDIIEVAGKNKEDNGLIDFSDGDDDCPCNYGDIIDEMCDDLDEQDKRIRELEERVTDLEGIIADMKKK